MQIWFLIVILSLVLLLIIIAVLLRMFVRDTNRTDKKNTKDHHIVQKLFSQDLHKRALIIEYGRDRYQVARSCYSDEIVNNITGEVAGWQSLKEKPVASSLYDAVQIAEKWLHEEN